ncbi:helix-turn-helix domain-containing protein [Paenibacillus amylolyticus]|uniref:AraC family transcriptional regulator n=1 Tax=Paenibacillus amylolyticus TaxID=1451 RepID=UPI00105923B7|nr:AraC family transcriptional regulator [Paenibacillus amylolyticus]TDL69934.1 helix-turn-helix domain-containing protein [Paenibacillus amylolyticus]
MWNDYYILWNYAAVRITDIRYMELQAYEKVKYKFPTSTFVLTIQGDAEVTIDNQTYEVSRFYVLHGGKGSKLVIQAGESGLRLYYLMYKANLPSGGRNDLGRLMERINPFQMNYGFTPDMPTILYEQLKQMHFLWDQKNPIQHFQAKSLFYAFVEQISSQIPRISNRYPSIRDQVSKVIEIVESSYTQPLTLHVLAEMIGTSPRSLSRKFKQSTGTSPIDYLIQFRLFKAKEMLLQTDATLDEIAVGIGYPDGYYLGRMFKKHTGLSPLQFKEKTSAPLNWHDLTSGVARNDIFRGGSERYVYTDGDNHYQYKHGGSINMNRQTRTGMLLSILLSLTLLLSACSTGVASNSSGDASGSKSASSSTNTVTADNQTKTSEPRTISTVKGDITIPAEPKRIVVDLYLGSLIALGIKPVGTPEMNLKNPYFIESLDGVQNIGEYETISLEKVLELEPDLIVTGNPDLFDSFSKIAPTLVVPYGELKNTHEEIAYFGEVLNKEKESEAWLADYDARIADAKKRVHEAIDPQAEVSVMQFYDKAPLAFGDNFGRGGQAVYSALGLNPPADKKEILMKDQLVEVSSEAIPEFAGDYIILTADNLTLEELKSKPVWSSLDAVKNDRVFIWSPDRSWYFDPIATLDQTEELAVWFTKISEPK